MLILPYLLLWFMGIVVWLVGWGWAILTVPILVYFFHIDPIMATFYSLIIVWMTALVWAIMKLRSWEIMWRIGILFGIPSIIATFFSRHTLVPSIPDHVFLIEKWTLLLLVFGFIMFAAGCSMVCKRKNQNTSKSSPIQKWKKSLLTIVEGWIVGTITGLVGAGGWFLIVPALMMLEWLNIKQAVATSLLIISLKSLIGSLGDITNSMQGIDVNFLIYAIVIAIIGLFVGLFLQKKIPAEKLSRWFGIFTMITAILMLSNELFF
jgi:uncharacterized membrane protein YfcA